MDREYFLFNSLYGRKMGLAEDEFTELRTGSQFSCRGPRGA